MGKNKNKNGQKGTKGLASIGEHVDKDALRHLELPKLGASNLRSAEELKQFRAAVDKAVAQVAEYGRLIASALGDEDKENLAFNIDGIFADEDQVTEFINSTENTVARRKLARAYLSALVAGIPHNELGLNHLADQGLELGYFSEAPENDKALHLPFMVDGNYEWQALSTPQGQDEEQLLSAIKLIADPVYSAFKQAADEAKAADQAAERTELDELNRGVESYLLDILKTGGETVFFVPDYNHGGRFFAGGDIRVKVADGHISPVAAVGNCAEQIRAAVKYGIRVPIQSLNEERLNIQEYVPPDEFSALMVFYHLCRRAYRYALKCEKKHAARAAMQERATVSINDCVLRDADGVAYFFSSKKETFKVGDRTFKGAEGLMERNEAGEFRVVDCPQNLEDLFSKCREFAPADRLEYPLGRMLKDIRSTLKRAEARQKEDNESPLPVTEADDGRKEFTPRVSVKADAEAALTATLKPDNQ